MSLPVSEPIPLPTDENDSARIYLEAHGLIPIQPPIRSSDEDTLLYDPFRSYLTRRLGLCPLLSYSAAKNRGTWFHTMAEAFTKPDPVAFADTKLSSRLQELADIATVNHVLPSALRTFQDIERNDFETTLAWFDACRTVRFNSSPSGTLTTYLADYRILATELTLSHTLLLDGKKYPLLCTLDALLYHAKTNTLHILDYKTCSEPAQIRLAKCPLEMASSLYAFIVTELISSGQLLSTFSLPANTTYGGFHHVAVQKPSIRLGQNDRSFRSVEFTPKSGPNKGITRIEREYFGEPTRSNYLRRCSDWYNRTGEYSSVPFEHGPPVDISHLKASFIRSPLILSRLFSRIRSIHSFATRDPLPSNFLRNPSGIYNRFSDKPSPYAHFYLEPVWTWPEYIAQERFLIDHRDDPSSPSD